MVGSSFRRFVSGAALVCTAIAVLPSAAIGQPTDQYYTTAITQVYGSEYPLTGRLDLEVFPDGTLRGYYHTTFNKLYIPVAGGRDGNYIWFDIGPSSVDLGLGAGPQGKLHIVATMNGDGSFRGQVYPETAAVLSGLAMQYQFASPAPISSNSNDQYIFTATPTTAPETTPQP
jgi:hypothetical protein